MQQNMSHHKITLLLPGYTTKTEVNDDKALPNLHDSFDFSVDNEHLPWQHWLLQMFGHDSNLGRQLPVARVDIANWGGSEKPDPELLNAGIVRADPLFLKADRDSATVLPFSGSMLTEDDADEVLEALNTFISEDGLQFFRGDACEWYLAGLDGEVLQTYPPTFLANRNASAFLPDGDGSAHWRRLLTELQMLMHALPVNQQREQRGLNPVNSVWFWGGAPLPQLGPDNKQLQLYSDNAQAHSLAKLFGVECFSLADLDANMTSIFANTEIVVVDDSAASAWLRRDVDGLEATLSRMNQKWLDPLVKHVSAKQLAEVTIINEDGLMGMCNRHSLSQSKLSQRKNASVTGIWLKLRGLFK